jgi:lactoylglutathione lyase|tara:strand:- start:79 stop:519 length:441 start_codon:yes stop_codon:yes gene_type:complete
MLKSFFHTGFVVKDIEASVKFYSEVFGMRIAGRSEREGEFAQQMLAFPDAHIKGGFLDMGEGHQLELIQYLSPASGENTLNRNDLGASHLAFLVEDVEKLYEETSKKGVTFNNPPASMFDEEGKLLRKAAYAQDPDGNWLEFIELF